MSKRLWYRLVRKTSFWVVVAFTLLFVVLTLLVYLFGVPIKVEKMQVLLATNAGALSILAAASTFLLQRTEDRYTSRLVLIYEKWTDLEAKARQVNIARTIITTFSKLRLVLLLTLIYLTISLFGSLFSTFWCGFCWIKSIAVGSFSTAFLCVAYFIFLLIEQMRQIEAGLKSIARIE